MSPFEGTENPDNILVIRVLFLLGANSGAIYIGYSFSQRSLSFWKIFSSNGIDDFSFQKFLHKAIEQLIEKDEALSSKVEKILTIKGVGLKAIAVLLAETNGFASF